MSRLLVVLVAGCAITRPAPPLRRALLTDEVPLGTEAHEVIASYVARGWCHVTRDDTRAVFRTCAPGQPVIVADLRFERGVLARADVIERRSIDALAFELESRHGRPVRAGDARRWLVGDETIELYRDRDQVIERHALVPCYGYC